MNNRFFAVYAFLVTAIGFVFIMYLATKARELDNFPFKYDVCTRFPGVEAKCETRARFSAMEACEMYAEHDTYVKQSLAWKQYCKQ